MKRISATLAPSRCSAENLRNYCKPSSQRGNGWDSRVPSNEPGTNASVPILCFGSYDLTVRPNKPGGGRDLSHPNQLAKGLVTSGRDQLRGPASVRAHDRTTYPWLYPIDCDVS
jgi:hypothetical protein